MLAPQVVLQCAPASTTNSCVVTRLARLANGDAPALWLARLVAAPDAEAASVGPCAMAIYGHGGDGRKAREKWSHTQI